MTDVQINEFRFILGNLKDLHRVSRYRIAKENGIERAEITRLANSSGYVAPATEKRIIRAVLMEAGFRGVSFDREIFVDYFDHAGRVA